MYLAPLQKVCVHAALMSEPHLKMERMNLNDATLLDRASAMQRIVFTRDDDFLVEAARRQREGIPFYGIIYAHQQRVSIGVCVEQLELIAKASELEDILNCVKYLPVMCCIALLLEIGGEWI
jgi:hypothetical protein